MADADGRIIPWVEDDQGEGIKDFLEEYAEAGRKIDELFQENMAKLIKKKQEE